MGPWSVGPKLKSSEFCPDFKDSTDQYVYYMCYLQVSFTVYEEHGNILHIDDGEYLARYVIIIIIIIIIIITIMIMTGRV